MAHKTIDPAQETKIVRYLKSHSQGATAKHFKISSSTVNRIAKEHPTLKPFGNCSEPKKATAAHKAYAKQDRLKLLNKITQEVENAIMAGLSPNDLKNLTIAVGTLLDKYRLEEKDMDDTSKGDASDLLNQMKKGDAGTK